MPSAALTSDVPHSRRFYQPRWQGHIALGILTFGIALGHIFAGHGRYHIFEGIMWIGFAVFYSAPGWAVWSELRPEGLVQHNFWATQLIPYTDITSIEQLEDMTRPIEVQYFSTSPNTFPRKKIVVAVSDRLNFIAALRELAPSAEFRT